MAAKPIVNHVILGIAISAIAPIAVANSSALAEDNINIPQQLVEPSLWWKSQRLQEGW